MSMIFFTYRARLEARRGAGLLREAGVPGTLERTPSRLSTAGCGFGIRVPEKWGREAARLLREAGFLWSRSYLLTRDRVREVDL